MREHYFTLAWDTYGKDGRKRHFSRHFGYEDREKAIRRAVQLNARQDTDRVQLRHMESWEEGDTTHIRFHGNIQYWMDQRPEDTK